MKTRYGELCHRLCRVFHLTGVLTTVVELNLRLPSMLHGKKGFERIVWAFKNVLNHSVTWLFYDFEKPPKREATKFNFFYNPRVIVF